MNRLKKYTDSTFFRHLLFWIGMFFLYSISNWEYFCTLEEVIVTYTYKVGLQCITAYVSLLWIIPRYLKKKNVLELVGSFILLFFVIHVLYISGRMGYLEVTYPESYSNYFKQHGHLSYSERVFDIITILFRVPLFYLQPAFLLIAIQFYQKQQKILEISEQKQRAELSALKNQLNPHFLFNTLNNLYALAIKKADETPLVISKLSDILDYMLYRCNEKFVDINKEIKLIENYITLEKIRYQKRVQIQFDKKIDYQHKIAPLLLLTFIENAFKHGVSQELNVANIEINLATVEKEILFKISNTIPKNRSAHPSVKQSIGLQNVKKQLELLYPQRHQLNIEETTNLFLVTLKIIPA